MANRIISLILILFSINCAYSQSMNNTTVSNTNRQTYRVIQIGNYKVQLGGLKNKGYKLVRVESYLYRVGSNRKDPKLAKDFVNWFRKIDDKTLLAFLLGDVFFVRDDCREVYIEYSLEEWLYRDKENGLDGNGFFDAKSYHEQRVENETRLVYENIVMNAEKLLPPNNIPVNLCNEKIDEFKKYIDERYKNRRADYAQFLKKINERRIWSEWADRVFHDLYNKKLCEWNKRTYGHVKPLDEKLCH